MATGIQSHPAMVKLGQGCAELHLPSDIAMELVWFLITKRSLLTGEEQHQVLARQMSPAVPVDELWHWMLLNSDARDAVHALVGGDVPHSTATAADLELVKQQRRLNALAAMISLGFSPNQSLWQAGALAAAPSPSAAQATPPADQGLRRSLKRRPRQDAAVPVEATPPAKRCTVKQESGHQQPPASGQPTEPAPAPPAPAAGAVAAVAAAVVADTDILSFQVQTPEGNNLLMRARAGDTVADLKQEMHTRLGYAVEHHCLRLDGRLLKVETTVGGLNLQHSSVLHLEHRPDVGGEKVTVFVITLTGTTHTCRVTLAMDVFDLKQMIEEKTGTPASEQRLLFAGKQLEDRWKLWDCGLRKLSTVQLVLRLRGC